MSAPIVSDDFLITSIYTDSHTDYESGDVYEFNEVLGIRLTKWSFENTVTLNEIILDGYSVRLEDYEREYLQLLIAPKLIPRWYMVRIAGTPVCGFDLTNSGYWVGLGEGQTFKTMKEALNFITHQIGPDFYICLEGEMRR